MDQRVGWRPTFRSCDAATRPYLSLVSRPFLTATWRHLVIVSYAVEPARLEAYLPPGFTLDRWGGETYLSLLGLLFTEVRVKGLAIPGHRRFPDVNLRCYVRRGGERGVVFIREIVPKPAVAWLARVAFGEQFRTLPLRHEATTRAGTVAVRYAWRCRGVTHELSASWAGEAQPIAAGSLEEFLAERHRGFVGRRGGGVLTYAIDRPRWRHWRPLSHAVTVDGGSLYGPQFADVFASAPRSVMVAEGSPVAVRRVRGSGAEH